MNVNHTAVKRSGKKEKIWISVLGKRFSSLTLRTKKADKLNSVKNLLVSESVERTQRQAREHGEGRDHWTVQQPSELSTILSPLCLQALCECLQRGTEPP